ncbi:uncharacterized protein LOC127289532 [Leptopilina boulardi]|uniref:uncharacterized protein LOC127289532 n=1 Tax=Leptopilina boulardi TaxID=63433 RepID=UPI0021F66D20|nr:uncharacterized protein LOC127289532 [Leptopilina boulardi]
MEKKNTAAYKSIFLAIKGLIPEFEIEEAHIDYEKALKNALVQVFPNINVHGCFFHHKQALFRYALKLRLKRTLQLNEDARHLLNLIMSLPLLPADIIRITYQEIRDSSSLRLKRIFASFFKYYEKEWLLKATPQFFSIFMLNNRTNNSLEAYYKVLKEKCGIHSTMWAFSECQGISVCRHSAKSLIIQKEMYKLIILLNLDTQFLSTNEIEVKTFLMRILTLPLLPPEKIESAFNNLKRNLSDECFQSILLFALTFDREWIRRVTPKRFSVYRDLQRISRIFELYSCRLHTLMGSFPTPWDFVKGIVVLQKQSYADYLKLVDNITADIKSRKICNRLLDTSLKRAWNSLEDETISVEEFLEICSNTNSERRMEFITAQINEPSEEDYAAVYPSTIVAAEDDGDDMSEEENNVDSLESNSSEIAEDPLEININENDAVTDENNSETENEPNSDENNTLRQNVCCICRDRSSVFCFVPCGHLNICDGCHEQYSTLPERQCPMCRAEYTQIIRVFM